MRVVRKFKSMIVLGVVAAALCVFAAGASAAPTFTFSSATSSTQAAAPTDLTFTFASPSPERLTDIEFALPDGMMHDPTAAPACPTALFNADRCPASSRVGTVASQFVSLGLTLNVPGAIFHVEDSGDAAATYGVVLRPPLSGLGLIEKSRVGHRILFDDRGAITARSSGMPTRFSTVLGSVPTRVSRFTWRFDGMNASGNLLHNPTSCPASRPFRATASFSDGSSLSRTAPATTTGCPLVPLRADASVVVDQTGEQRTSFAILLTGGDRSERGALHSDHVKSLDADLGSLGTFDTEMLAAMPACPTEVALSLRCSEASRVGSFSTSVEGLTGPLEGELHRSPESPTSIGGVLDLPGDRIVGFKIEIDGVPVTSKNIKMSIPSPLPLEQTVVKIEAPILKLQGKPSSCTNRETRMTIGGYSAGQRTWKPVFAAEPCPPVANFADAGDADADGDGLADKSLKPENFHVWYSVADGGNGVDPGSLRCELESHKPELAVRGKVKSVKDTGSGYFGCEVTEAAGDVTVVFSVASIDGHVTVLKSSYNVDSEAPVLESAAPDPVVSSRTSFELMFDTYDERLSHPQSEYSVECVLRSESGEVLVVKLGRIELSRSAGSGEGTCMWDTGKSGRFMLEVVVRDSGGHVTVLKRTAVVDAEGPTISLTDDRDQDSDGDGKADDELRAESFDIPFSVSDAFEVEADSVACKLIVPVAMDKDLRVEDTDGDGMADVCRVNGAPIGEIAIDISAADWRGHVTVLKIGFTGDNDAPVVESATPETIDFDTEVVTFDFEFTDDTLAHPQSEFVGECVLIDSAQRKHAEFAQIDVDREARKGGGRCQWDTGRFGKSEPTYEMNLRLKDKVGHVTLIKRTINVDTEGPTITLTDPRDEDSDGDGLADDELRPSDFDIPILVADGSGRTDNKVSCNVAFTNPIGKCVPVDLDGDGYDDVVRVSDAPGGPLSVEISAIDWRGHVTVLKIGYTVDSDDPFTPGPDLPGPPWSFSSPDIALEYDVTDDTMTHLQSEYSNTCAIRMSKTGEQREGSARIIVDRDSGRSKGFCAFDDVADGDYEIVLRIRDKVGHVTLIKRTASVDTQGPVISLANPEGTDSDGDGVFDEARFVRNFDRAIVVTDHSDLDLRSVKCTVRGWDPTTKQQISAVDLDGDGLADVCRITDAPDGLHMIEISAADVHGHVTVLKLAVTVEVNPPVVTITSPSEGATIPYNGTLTVGFDVVSETAVTAACRVDTIVIAMACSSGQTFTVTGMGAGGHVLSVTVEDEHGLTTTASRSFSVASPPPGDVCIAIHPPPEGCPGYIPPGSTICVTVPYPICYPAGSPPGGTITLP